LANRREGATYLTAQAELCHRLNMPLGLAFIDIDHFKAVNDIHGHLAGDQVIQQVAQVLKNAIRASDLVCRWGGEEFIVIAPNANLEQMARVAEKMRLAVLQALASHNPPVTVSIGVAANPGKTIDQMKLITDADAALYAAKQKGRNRVELAT
jgi:diguanylate cyclase (GGDEF)-like protein